MRGPDIHTLTSQIASALDAIVPDGWAVRAEGIHILVTSPNGGWSRILFGENVVTNVEIGNSDKNAIRAATANLLQELQDDITIANTVPWPRANSSGRYDFADPHVELVKGVLSMWYGDRQAPALPVVRAQVPSRVTRGSG